MIVKNIFGELLYCRLKRGKRKNRTIAWMVFGDLNYVYWLYMERWTKGVIAQSIELFYKTYSYNSVIEKCSRCDNIAKYLLVSTDIKGGLYVGDTTKIICENCRESVERRMKKYRCYRFIELSLAGALSFCGEEKRWLRQRKVGRALAFAYGISGKKYGNLTENKVYRTIDDIHSGYARIFRNSIINREQKER